MTFQSFLKNLLRSFLTLRKAFAKKLQTRLWYAESRFDRYSGKKHGPTGTRRSPHIESLEAREMLAVSILSSPIAAYAQQDNPAEIRFELTNSNDAAAQIEFVVKQVNGSSLDPSKLTVKNLSTGQTVALSNIVDGTASSSATASLKSGSYAIIVAADAGSGNFTLDILQEAGGSNAKSGLDILVAAAISQQQTGWSYRIAHFNTLLAGTAYAGAASAKSILSAYPEVDVNGDGKVDNTDSELAKTLLVGGGSTTSKVSTVSVVAQDRTSPTITVGLKNDTGTANDKITTDATIVGRVTDASGIKSASYKLDNGSWVALSLDASGNYTIPNSGVAAGSHTVTISATDAKGNTSASAYTFTIVSSASPGNSTGSAVTSGGSGTAKISSSVTVQSVNGSAISAGKTVTLADNRGAVALAADGTLTFTPGSYYTKLAQGESETIALAIVSKDAYGHSYTSTLSFTVTGKNDLPRLTDSARPNLNVNENNSGTIASSALLGKWTDPDKGAVLSIASASVASVSCSNSALNSTFTASALDNYVTLTSNGVKLDATSSFFDVLGAGETLTITVAYKVKDQFGTSGDTGYLTFTVIGQNDLPTLVDSSRPSQNIVEGSSGTITAPTILGKWKDAENSNAMSIASASVSSVSCSNAALASQFTVAGLQQYLGLSAGGVTFDASNSIFVALAAGDTLTVTVAVKVKDNVGTSTETGYLTFTITGENALPTLADSARPNLNVNENSGGTLAASTLLGKWTDPDHGAVLSIASASVASVSCSNSALNSTFTASALGNYVTLTSDGVKLDATSSFFDALGAGETLTITVAYKVKDQFGTSGDTGYLTLTVIGQNDAPIFTAGNWTVSGMISNDNTSSLKSVNPGLAASDADYKDSAALRYSYSNVTDGANAAANGLITNFDASTGTFQIDTSKLTNRNTAGTITMLVTVGSAEGGTVSKTLTIHYAPETTAPTVSKITATVTETQAISRTVTPTVKGSSGYAISGLTVVTETGYGGLPSGVSLNSIVSLGKNGDGSIGFAFNPGTNFEYLQVGETLKLKLRYTVTDTQYGNTGAGFIELTITGAASPARPPSGGVNNAIGSGGQYATTESGGSTPTVTVPKSEVLTGWTLPDGNSSYSIVPGTVTFKSWIGNSTYASTTNPLGTSAFGSINVDASGNLVFTPNAAAYAALGQGQWIDLAVEFQVRDAAGNLVPGGTVLFRINGSNDDPVLVAQKDSGFSFASNSKTAASINPGFTKSDLDLNDSASTLVYDLDATSKSLGFSIGNDGVITIGNGDMAALDGSYTISVILRDNYGGSATKNISTNFYKEAAPTLADTAISIAEKDAPVSTNLNGSITKKTGHTYSFSQSPTPTHYSTDGVTWTSISGSVYDLTGCWTFNTSTGEFTFGPNGKFDGLTSGESLYFKFEYKVSDNGYNNCEATGSLTVQVAGVNDAPTQLAGTPARTETVSESASAPVKEIENLLAGWTDADHANSELKITDLVIAANGGSTLISLAKLQSTASEFLKISADGRTIEFDPSHEIFRRLGLGQSVELTISYIVSDPKDGTGTGSFTLTVNGSNDPPTLVFDDFVWTISETAGSATLDLTPYVTDLDPDDSHYVVKINGETVVTGWSKTLEGGATIKYLGGLTLQYELNGKFEYLSQGYSAFDGIFITITDGVVESPATKLNIEIQGVHTPIRLVSDATVTKTVNVNDLDAIGHLDTIQVVKDSNDTLKYTVVCTGSDGATYNDLFMVDAAGKFVLNPVKIASLNKNLTYTVAVTIENANVTFGDQALLITYTLDFVHRVAPVVSNETLVISQNAAEGTKDLAETYKTGSGYAHEVVLTTNGTSVVLTAGTDFIVENGVFKFLAAGKFDYLQVGESVDLVFAYKIIDTSQGNGAYYAEATLTVTVQGENDAPVFTTPALVEALDSMATEIEWRNFFSDVDVNDTLTLTGINGTAFDGDGKVVVAGIGEFYLDGDEKLWFTPDAAFNSLKLNALGSVLKVTLDVEDSYNEPAVGAEISLQVKGTNKPPVVTADSVPNQSVKTPIVISVSDIAKDINGDDVSFHSIVIGGTELIAAGNWNETKNAWIFELAAGTTVTLNADKTTLTIDGTTRNDFLIAGATEDFSLEIRVVDEYGALSATKTVTTGLDGVPATAPIVVDRNVNGLTEDDTEAPTEIVLSGSITDSNVPCRDNADGWYAISWNGLASAKIGVTDLDSARLAEISGFLKYENGVVTFNAPVGYFDFLNENETLVLTFTYAVTDNTYKGDQDADLVTTGTITVEIDGVNDAPTIDGLAVLNVTLSQAGPGGDIAVGGFTTDDADDGDVVTLSVGNVTGTKNGLPLEVCPTFEFIGNGLKTTNTNMPELAPGEHAEFTIEIVATDKFGAKTTKTVVTRIYAKTLAEVTVDGTKLDASEGAIVKSTPIIVADKVDEFRTDTRTGDDWYDKPAVVTVTVPSGFENKITDPTSFFSVGGNSTDGYSLDFTGTKADFAFLREGEKLEFSVTINVADKDFDAVTTTIVTVTVTGVGDAHTVGTFTGSFDYWANRRADQSNAFHPGYGAEKISDLDWKSEYGYSLQNIAVDAPPAGFDSETLEKLVTVDAETGEIKLNESGLTGLKAGFKYTLTVRIASTGEYADEHYVDVEIVLNIKVVDAPTVAPIIAGIDESGTVSETIGITAPDDDVSHSYTISDPTLSDVDFDYTGPLPDGFDWNTILDGLASIGGGKFEFDPNSALDFLPEGSTLVLTYTFTVSDDDFDAKTPQTVIITITGKNNSGIAAKNYDVDGVHEIGSTTKHEVFVADIADLVQDVDLGDSHTLVSIDGVAIAYNTWTAIVVEGKCKGEFYYYGGTLGTDGLYYGGSLKYRPSASEFESLRFGTENILTFTFVLQDDSGVFDGTPTTEAGSFSITVSGTNKMPVVNSGEQRSVNEGEVIVISASEIASDVNDGDKLRIYKVNGKTGDFQLADGTTVRFLDGGKFLEIDTRTRDAGLNMLPGDSPVLHSLSIVVADDSGADNFYSLAKSLTVTINPVDEGPTMSETHEFGIGIDDLKDDTVVNLGYVDFSDPDTLESEYNFSIVYNGKNPGFGLKANDPTRIYFIFDSKHFVEGIYTFQVVATLASDPSVTCTTTVSVTLSKMKAPAVSVEYPEDGTRLSLTETDDFGSVGVTVTDPNGDDADGWYTVTNIRCVNGTLPEGATLEYDPVGNRFVFTGGGAFASLRAGETATLVFEFTVRNNEHRIDTVSEIVIDIAGSNNRPEADDYSAMLNIPDNTADGIKFYLSELASDRDAGDTLKFHTVCGETITKDGEAVILKRGEDILGYVTWKSDEKGDYLHFMPNGYFVTLRHLETETAWFEYTVIDNSGDDDTAVSNTGTISFNVVGTNKKPVIDTTEGVTREDQVHEITAKDIASDTNTGDTLRIVGIKYGGNIYMITDRDQEPISLTLDSGATLTLHGDGRLVYDPTTRHRNMSAGDTDLEEFELIVADDSGDVSGNSVSEWTKFTLEIKGVNATPVDLLPNVTEYVTELQGTVYERQIDLRDHFDDVDENDVLIFSIKSALDKFGFLAEQPVIAEDGYTLVLRYRTLADYTNGFDLSAVQLTVVVNDGIETVEKTLTFRVTQQHTVSLDVIATPDASGTEVGETGTPPEFPTEPLAVAADDEYYIEVWASDLLNDVIADGMSGGLASVAFSLYWTSPDLIVEYEALGAVEMNSIGIRVLAEGLDLNAGLAGNDVLLLRLKVTAGGEGAVVGFQIDPASVQVQRQGEDGSVHASQVEAGAATVTHLALDDEEDDLFGLLAGYQLSRV